MGLANHPSGRGTVDSHALGLEGRVFRLRTPTTPSGTRLRVQVRPNAVQWPKSSAHLKFEMQRVVIARNCPQGGGAIVIVVVGRG